MTAPEAGAEAVVVGGSVAGLATALALAGRGHTVRVLERAAPPPDGPPAKAAETWHRPTVPQAGHSHILTSVGVRELRTHAPHVLETVLEEGARLLDLTTAAPPVQDAPTVTDPELMALATRRAVLELVLHRAVRSLPQVTISHATTVRGLILDPSRTRVTGVVTGTGEHVRARFVVDATGRKSASRSWLTDAGVPVADDLTAPSNLRCFTRFYRQHAPGDGLPGPLNRGNAAGGLWDHYAAVAHPADNGIFVITLGTPPTDAATDVLRQPGAFTAAARLSPFLQAWTDERTATPLTPVTTMTLPPNILRGTARPGTGRLTPGLFPVGDAACVTDPLYGRGMSLALRHAFRLAALLDEHPAVGEEQSESAARLADEVFRPWYEQSVTDDLARDRLWRARIDGTELTAPAPATSGRPGMAEVARAAAADPAVWHGLTRMLMGLSTPAEVFDDDAFRARVRTAPVDRVPPPTWRPPTRQELLDAAASAASAVGEEALR